MSATIAAEPVVYGPKSGDGVPAHWLPAIRQTASGPFWRERSVWFAAELDEVVAAVGALRVSPDEAWMGPSLVLPDFRGLGLQLLLIQHRLEHARSAGLIKVVSAVDTTNTASLRNMLNAGFRVTGYEAKLKHLELVWESRP